MKIVVFGGSGFLGSFVADFLSEAGHHVVIYDIQKSPYRSRGQEMVVGDILDRRKVDQVVRGGDIVYNFAGIADMDVARKEPYKTLYTNTIGNLNILDACVNQGVNRFVFASTVYVYGNSGSFYRASKQGCELAIEAYSERLGLKYTVLRYGSLYGPRSGNRHWIHRMLRQALTERKIVWHGDGEEIREYIHILDAARLSVKILAPEFQNQYVIITGQQPMRIRNVMIMIKEMLHHEVELEFLGTNSDEHYEMTPYHFRPKLAKRIVDSSYVDLGQGILELLNSMAAETNEGAVLKLEPLENR